MINSKTKLVTSLRAYKDNKLIINYRIEPLLTGINLITKGIEQLFFTHKGYSYWSRQIRRNMIKEGLELKIEVSNYRDYFSDTDIKRYIR